MKLPKLPPYLFNQEWEVNMDQDGLSEDGEPLSAVTVTSKFWFSDKPHQVMDAEKRLIRLEGTLTIPGDLFPAFAQLTTGTAIRGDKSYKVYRCKRPRNPDGSVYATIMELM
ncbi:MAG: hypothetical protein CVU95_00925 [Firmicutes bacterium HGW-Firmicutes-2]|jgi:hypothetical protein|nr:MAG: hypothetical protein CVU95_00925 [Firmicutes bacterium HGW-Firmicutes-2]